MWSVKWFFVPSLSHPLLSTVYQCDGCLSSLGRGGSWLGCQVLPAISAVSILELVAKSGSSRMSRAPNLHSLRATMLFTYSKFKWYYMNISYNHHRNNFDRQKQTKRLKFLNLLNLSDPSVHAILQLIQES